jgi:hypothetical protein
MNEDLELKLQLAAKGAHDAKNKLAEVAHCVELAQDGVRGVNEAVPVRGELRLAQEQAQEARQQVATLLGDLNAALGMLDR